MFKRWIGMGGCVLTLLCTAGIQQVRAQTFSVTSNSLGGGLYDYNIKINNTGGAEPLQGVLVFNASSLFGLNSHSVIDAPTGWSLFAPVPPVVNQITYMSGSPSSDIAVGSSLGGFSFESTVNPNTVKPSAWDIDGVGSHTAHDIHIAPVPEGSSLLAFSAGCLCLLGLLMRHRKKAV